MRIFLSARYERRDEMREIAEFLRDGGNEVMGTWIDNDQMDFTGMDDIPNNPGEKYAWEDFLDIKHSDVFICFTESLEGPKGRGGRHVEYGFAWALQKPIIIVGYDETVFHAVNSSDIWRMKEWDEELCVEYLDQIEEFLFLNSPRRRN